MRGTLRARHLSQKKKYITSDTICISIDFCGGNLESEVAEGQCGQETSEKRRQSHRWPAEFEIFYIKVIIKLRCIRNC